VNDSASSQSKDDSSLAALPPELASQSLSRTNIILPVDAAIQAIAHLSGQGRRLENWEGWVKMRDGGRAKSLAHSGSFALPADPARAGEVAAAGIRRAKAMWDRNPEYPGATLYVELTFGAV
jgi:hypothetical protein